MARFLIHWTESVDHSGYIEVDDCATEDQLREKISTDAGFHWYPQGDQGVTEAIDSEITKRPWYIERMED